MSTCTTGMYVKRSLTGLCQRHVVAHALVAGEVDEVVPASEISTLIQSSPYVLYGECVMNVGGCGVLDVGVAQAEHGLDLNISHPLQ